MSIIDKTLKFYSDNCDILFERYEKTNLEQIDNYLLNIVKKDNYILELGFGSGREIKFLYDNGFYNIYGIDGCGKFVGKAKKRFKNNDFYVSILPNIDIPQDLKFDLIYSIAVWMHLPISTYEETIKNIVSRLKANGKVFLSYSLEDRNEKERYFQKVDDVLIEELFNNYNLKKVDEFITTDSLNRNINWKNQLYKMSL